MDLENLPVGSTFMAYNNIMPKLSKSLLQLTKTMAIFGPKRAAVGCFRGGKLRRALLYVAYRRSTHV